MKKDKKEFTVRRLIRLLLIALIILSGFSLQAQEVTKVGTTAAKFLSIPVGARALAMGAPIPPWPMTPAPSIGTRAGWPR